MGTRCCARLPPRATTPRRNEAPENRIFELSPTLRRPGKFFCKRPFAFFESLYIGASSGGEDLARPKKETAQQLRERIERYFSRREAEGRFPTEAGMLLELGMSEAEYAERMGGRALPSRA